MTQKTLYIALLLLFVLTLGCKKDQVPCTTCPTGGANCEDIQNVKHFFYFKVGSWWVYEEENSGARDSVYVTEAAEDPSNYNFDVRVYSTYQDYYYHFWPVWGSTSSSCSDHGVICKQCIKIERSKYKPGEFVSQGTCFIFIPKVGFNDLNFHNQIENYIRVTGIEDSSDIGGFSFERTIEMYEDRTLVEGDQPTNHYFSENVGLVRKELLDSNEVWNLVNYYIAP